MNVRAQLLFKAMPPSNDVFVSRHGFIGFKKISPGFIDKVKAQLLTVARSFTKNFLLTLGDHGRASLKSHIR